MKKTYLKPETHYLEVTGDSPFMVASINVPVNNGGTTGSTDDDDETDDYDDLLAKPCNIYEAWEDDDFDL